MHLNHHFLSGCRMPKALTLILEHQIYHRYIQSNCKHDSASLILLLNSLFFPSYIRQPKDQEAIFKQKTHELGKKWSDTCLHLHPNFHQNIGSERNTPTTGLYNPKLAFCSTAFPTEVATNQKPGGDFTIELKSSG